MLSNKLVVIHNHEVPSSILGPATKKDDQFGHPFFVFITCWSLSTLGSQPT